MVIVVWYCVLRLVLILLKMINGLDFVVWRVKIKYRVYKFINFLVSYIYMLGWNVERNFIFLIIIELLNFLLFVYDFWVKRYIDVNISIVFNFIDNFFIWVIICSFVFGMVCFVLNDKMFVISWNKFFKDGGEFFWYLFEGMFNGFVFFLIKMFNECFNRGLWGIKFFLVF